MAGPVSDIVFWSEREKAPSVEYPAPWASTARSWAVPPQYDTLPVFGVTEAAAVKVPLIGTPSSARAPLGAETKVMAASSNRPREIRSRFLLEIGFRNIVISSVEILNNWDSVLESSTYSAFRLFSGNVAC
jgi:hypothetical protein